MHETILRQALKVVHVLLICAFFGFGMLWVISNWKIIDVVPPMSNRWLPRVAVYVGSGTIAVYESTLIVPNDKWTFIVSPVNEPFDFWSWSYLSDSSGFGEVSFPIYILCLVPFGIFLLVWRKDIWQRRLPGTHICRQCGYDQSGIALMSVCPECGVSRTS